MKDRHELEKYRLRSIIERLYALEPKLLADVCAEVRTNFEVYAQFSTEQLEPSIRLNLRQGTRILQTRQKLSDEEISEYLPMIRERLHQGIAVEDIINAFRLNMNVLHAAFITTAEVEGMPPSEILHNSALLWDLGSQFAVAATNEFLLHIGRASANQMMERANDIRSLLKRRTTPAEKEHIGKKYGLVADQRYAVIISPPGSLTKPESTRQKLAQQGLLLAEKFLNRDVGVVTAEHKLSPNMHAAQGTHEYLFSLANSASVAEIVWRRAQLLVPGLYDLTQVGWRALVPVEKPFSDYVTKQYIDPISPGTPAGEAILETVEAFLTHAQNVRQTAEYLVIHPNTVRYRIQKYEETLEIELSHSDTMLEVRWAIEAYRAELQNISFGEFFRE